MPERNLFQIYTNRLNKLGIQYMVTGAVASMIYGEPRLTHDIDLVAELTEESAEKILKAFPLDEFYCPPIEVVRVEMKRPLRGHFNLIHHETGFKADIYTMGRDGLHRWAMLRRREVEVEGSPLWVAPPEYVILRKLEYYRESRLEKHLRDIVSMIEISEDQIDFEELQTKITDDSIQRDWRSVQRLLKNR